ncbi:hypothetical protein ACFXPZ_18135 [Streptomyces sp. NPDC059101]|uniref:DUF6197 family protein n=1 Tax=Streptomyces sp. NPDC059101 TaxID=3346728 RepID=UPI0036C610FD
MPERALTADHPTPHRPTAAPVELSFDERLTLTDMAMTVRLDEATVAYEVNTAHIPTTPVDLADIVTRPLDTTPTPLPDLDPHPTPVAALLQRAHRRLLTDGWCAHVLVDRNGARCLVGAIHIEAGGDHRLEDDAATVLLDAIRRQFGDDVDSVTTLNDAFGTGRVPIRMVDHAARLADARGL